MCQFAIEKLLLDVKASTPLEVRERVGNLLTQKEGFNYLYEIGVIQYLIPELSHLEDYHHNLEYHPEGSLYNHYCEVFKKYCENPSKTELGAWAVLFHDVAKTVVAEWRQDKGHHTFYLHEKVGGEIFQEKYFNGVIYFNEIEAEAIKWVIRQHRNFYKVARKQKSLDLVNHPDYDLLLEVTKADSMGANSEFYQERLNYFKNLQCV